MIDKRVAAVEAALAGIGDGATIMLGGFGRAGVPEVLLEGLGCMGLKGLTIVSNGAGRPDSGLARLFAAGAVRKLIASSARGRDAGMSPFERGWRAGEIELELVPQGTFVERMRCAGAGLGGFWSPVGVGSAVTAGKEVRSIDGRDYVLEYPLRGDVALLAAERADRWGNLSYRYAQRNFQPAMAVAAKLTIVEAEQVGDLGSIAPMDVHTPGVFVDRVLDLAALNRGAAA